MLNIEVRTQALLDELASYGEQVRTKGVQAGAREAAKAVNKAIKAEAPRDFGSLQKAVAYRRLKRNELASQLLDPKMTAGDIVGVMRKVQEKRRRGDGTVGTAFRHQKYKAYWMNFTGTAPHRLEPKARTARKGRAFKDVEQSYAKGRRVLAFGGRFRWYANHPGTRKNPFIDRGSSKVDHAAHFAAGLEKFQEKFMSEMAAKRRR